MINNQTKTDLVSPEQLKEKAKQYLESKPKSIGDFDSRLQYIKYLFEQTKLNLQFNVFTKAIELNEVPIEYSELRLEIAEEFNYDLPLGEESAINSLLKKLYPYNPITDYLDSLDNAKKSPYEHIANAFGLEPDSFDTKLIVLTLLGAVNRAYKPGCKMQSVLIFMSIKQALFKSTFWEAILPIESMYVEPVFTAQENKYLMSCYTGWFVNMNEIDTMFSKKAISENKDFITRTRDTFVPMYGRRAQKFSRHWILVGSTNEDELFRDVENRRYWVVPLTKPIDIDYVLANRDDIWAGILELYMADTQFWFDFGSEDAELLKQRNLLYREDMPFSEKLILFIEHYGNEPFTLKFCLDKLFNTFAPEPDKKLIRQIKTELKAMGYAPGARAYFDGKQQRVWTKMNQ